MKITVSEWNEWKLHPATKVFIQKLQDAKQERMETWAQRGYIGETAEQSSHANAAALGAVAVLDDLIGALVEPTLEGESA